MKFDIQYLFTAKYAKWLIGSLIIIFSSLIVAEWTAFIFSSPGITVLPTGGNNLKAVSRKDSLHYILNSSLFGVYVPDINGTQVKKSMLNVTLAGILFAGKAEDSQVIIRSSAGVEKTYKTGDTIPGGAVIKRIMSEGVLLEREGILESLSLPKNDLIFEPVAKPLKSE